MPDGYGRTSNFCGAAGMDLMEPLTFKGREGSGLPGGRCAYADASLNPKFDWKKFEIYYRVMGRRLYRHRRSKNNFRNPRPSVRRKFRHSPMMKPRPCF